MARAVAAASQVTSVAMEMVAPPLLGYWVDQWLGTAFVFLAIGGVLGVVLGVMTLVRLAPLDSAKKKKQPSNGSQ